MGKKKKVLLLVLLVIIVTILIVGLLFSRFSKSKNPISQPLTERISSAVSTSFFTKYSNQEYNFSLSYPAAWNLPKETKITPPQQHLYQIIFNLGGEEYFIDVYRQMMPLPLTNFVRDYFTEASWIEGQKINEQEVVRFFLPKSGLEPNGTAGIVFTKGNDVLVISTSILKGEKEKIINDPILNQLARSFVWQN